MEAVFRYGHHAYTMKMGIRQNYLIYLVILCFCFFHSITCCSVFEVQYGNVTEDQILQVGSTLTFQCTLFPETVEKYGLTSKDLFVKLGKNVLPETQVVDNYTVQYEVESSSVDDSGFYQCFVPIPGYEKPQLVCASAIHVGTKPKEVSNFTCIGYGYTNLTCSWIPPPNKVETKYELSDYLSNNPMLYRKCPLPVPRISTCQFNLFSSPPYMRGEKVLNFILRGRNPLGDITEYFTVNHFEIVKPNKPSKVSLKDVSKDSMVIEILAPKGLDYGEYRYGLVYVIKYYSVSTKLEGIQEVTVQNKTSAQLKIKNLVPHTQYKFEVRCHLNVTGDHYYLSDEVNVTEITRSDVPYIAPEIDASSFDVQFIDNNAIITLYWKAVPAEFENGEKFHYVVKYHEHYVPTRYKRRAKREADGYVRVENSTTHTFNRLDKDTAYMFTIVAGNDVGQSSNHSAVIVVDKAKKLLLGPKDITVVLYSQGHYDISWKSSDPQLNNFTIAVCETLKSRPAKCEGPISYIAVQNRTHHKFHLLNAQTNYQFAVAATAEGSTSGLHWAPCIVTYGVVYGVKTVQMMPKTSTSLRLSWSYLCPAVTRVIREIEIAMCPSQETCSAQNFERCSVNDLGIGGWPTHHITNSSATEMVIGDLRPFTQYYAVIRIRTDAGFGAYSGFSCESTMPSAPSDPPSDVYVEVQPVQDSLRASIRVSFEPPNTPNGIISRYVVYYNNTSSSGDGKEKEVRIQDNKGTATVLDNIPYHTNYSIEVTACVGQACSPLSEPLYLYTGVSNPGIVNLPRVEMREKDINISWDAPVLPNGPLDYYQILMTSNQSKKEEIYNVSNQNFMLLERKCDSKDADNNKYEFRVRAINMKEGMPFYGDYSRPLQTLLCSHGGSLFLYIGGTIVGVIAIGLFFLAIIYLSKWTAHNILSAKHTKVQLPEGLESSLDNPLSTYDKFKSGLQNNHDSGIPYERGYERFFSPASQGDVKNTDELSKRGASGRNLSGESNFSGKCQDSISSANTTKTHNSIDSGAEIESPPSPDSFCSDSGSANTTPRAFKPGLDIVNEINPLNSKDSGLEKESLSCIAPNFSRKNMWYVRRPNDVQLGAYSRFAVRGASNPSPYVMRGEPNLAECRSLSNSEPSVADFDVGDGTEPLVNPVMHPYSKFGLARSASNGINLRRNSQPAPGYSKFGIVYRPFKNTSPLGPHDQHMFPATMCNTHPFVCNSFCKKEDAVLSDKTTMPKLGSDAYSKFGVVEVDSTNGNLASGLKDLNQYVRINFPEVPSERGLKPEGPYCSLPLNGWDKKVDGVPSATSNYVAYPDMCAAFSQSASDLNATNFPEPADVPGLLLSPMNGLSPSHKPCLDGQSPQEADAARVQVADDFISKALTGGHEVVPVSPENKPPDAAPPANAAGEPALNSSTKPVNYAFRKMCFNDELLSCLDRGCLPELVLPILKPIEDDAFFELPNYEPVRENCVRQLGEAGKDFSSEDSENNPPRNCPVPNAKDSENVAQVVQQSKNSSIELV